MSKLSLPENIYDVVILGGGAAGLTAGMYAARAGLNTVLLAGSTSQSQITYTPHVENFPGFPEGVGGYELIQKFKKQATRFGLQVKAEDAVSLKRKDLGEFKIWEVMANNTYQAVSVIIATGTSWRKMGIPGEDEFVGRGISYCATCDAPFFRNKRIAVIGGGDTAVEEAIFLTKFADKVTIVHRRDRLRATAVIQERAFSNPKIDFIWESAPQAVLGENAVNTLKIQNIKTGQSGDLIVDGVFIFIGLDPNTSILKGIADLDKGGYIQVNRDMKTSAEGIFACGDCTGKLLRQVITACGDGATAGYSAQLYVREVKGESY